uniref:Putative interferon-induced 6-16 family n=1 Tax=Ixodes ricinus TaxID=34613 RepID=A0A131Y660_IXORI
MAVPEPPTDSTGQIEAGVTRTVPRPPAEMLDIPETTAGTLRNTVSDAAFHDPSQTAASACAGPMSTETATTTSHCTESFTGCSKGPPDEKLSRPTEPGKQGCQSSKVSSASKFWKANKKTLITVGACAGAAVAGLVVPPLLIGGLGFGAGGVVAGSTAASIQSLMGGVVVKGGLFATMQSWGAVGIPAAAQSLFAACSGATGLGTTTLLMKDKKKQTCEVCKCSKACKCCEACECSEACECCEVCKCTGTCKCREACKKSEAACKCNETCKHSETCKCNETCKHSETCKCSEAGKGGEAIKTASLQGQ